MRTETKHPTEGIVSNPFQHFLSEVANLDVDESIEEPFNLRKDGQGFVLVEDIMKEKLDPTDSMDRCEFADNFFTELLGFLKNEMTRNDQSSDEIIIKIRNINRHLFSTSPNITNNLTWEDLFKHCAIYNRQNPVFTPISDRLFESLVYAMEFTHDEEILSLEKGYQQQSDITKLDYLDLIDKISQATLDSGYADRTLYQLKSITEDICQLENKPILRYAANLTNHKLDTILRQENDEPVTDGLEAIYDYSDEQNEFWQTRIKLNLSLPDYKIIQVAKNCFAAMDSQNKPQYYALTESTFTPPEVGMSLKPSDYELILKDLQTPENVTDINYLEQLLSYLAKNIINPHFGIKQSAKTAEIFSQISQALSKNQWQELFKNLEIIIASSVEIENIKNKLTQEAEVKNDANFHKYRRYVIGEIKKGYLDNFIPNKQELLKIYDQGYWELFEKSVNNFISMIRFEKNYFPEKISSEVSDFYDECQGFEAKYDESFIKAEEAYTKFCEEKKLEIEKNLEENAVLLRKIALQPENFSSSLTELIENIYKTEQEGIPELNFKSYESLPSDKINIKKEESDVALLIQHLHRPDMRYYLEARLGVKFNDIPLSSEIQFLKIASISDSEQFSHIEKILSKKQFNQEFIISFLSSSGDESFSESLIKIAEQIDPDIAKLIFERYAQIADTIDNVQNYLTENYQTYNLDIEKQITGNLFEKGKKLLSTYAETPDKAPEEIIQELDMIQANLMLTATTFKTLKQENPDLTLEELSNVKTEIILGTDISPQDQEELLKILKANWDHPEFATIYEDLKDHMEKSFTNPNIRYYIARDTSISSDGRQSILTFQRFEDVAPGVTYASGNNVHPSARGSRIGEAAQKTILGQELEKNLVIADAYPKSDITQHYINKSGFVATGIYRDYEGTGQPYFCMVNDKPVNDRQTYFWRSKTPEELVAAAKQETIDPNHIVLEIKLGETLSEDPEENARSQQLDDTAAAFLKPYFDQNFVITAMAKGENGNLILGLEPDQSSQKIRVINDKYEIISQAEPVKA